MSRYHSVRPKPKHHEVPTPAAPAQPASGQAPAPAQSEHVRARMLAATDALYKDRGGVELDASIARFKKLLAIHDRELEVVTASDFSKPHRWTVSPSIALRVDKLLHDLLDRREQLLADCLMHVKQALAQIDAAAGQDSLCPPKWTEPAPEAASSATTSPAPSEKEPAEASPIAA